MAEAEAELNHSEEPVREKLQETTISPAQTFTAASAPEEDGSGCIAVEDVGHAATDAATENGHVVGSAGRKRALDEAADTKPVEESIRKKPKDLDDEEYEDKPRVEKMEEDEGTKADDTMIAEDNMQDETAPVSTEDTGDSNDTRQRAATPTAAADSADEGGRDAMASPANKRRHEEMVVGHDPERVDAANPESAVGQTDSAGPTQLERAAKRQKSQSPEPKGNKAGAIDAAAKPAEPTANIPPTSGFADTSSVSGFGKIASTSGFANTSSVSPFAALASPKPAAAQPQKSGSAFASSGFGALASSSSSPFGSLGKTAPTTSPFGALGSGGGFGALAAASGTKSSVFSGGSGPKIVGLSDKPAKPFGAADGDEEDEQGDEDTEGGEEEGSEQDDKSEVQVPKVKLSSPPPVETGEENETTVYACRAKLYAFVTEDDKREWKERGLGTLKLNIPISSPHSEEPSALKKARILMRADGSHRLILNSPIQKGTVSGQKPTGTNLLFLGQLPGETHLQTLQLKMKSQFLSELWDHIVEMQKDAR